MVIVTHEKKKKTNHDDTQKNMLFLIIKCVSTYFKNDGEILMIENIINIRYIHIKCKLMIF